MTRPVVLLCLALATFVSGAADATAEQDSKGSLPFVGVEQDGRLVAEKQGEVRLRRAPFTLIVRMSPMTVVTAHLSTTAEGYDLARARQSMDPIFPLGGAFAEGDKNDARTVYLSDPAQPSYHAWYYDGPNDHRFDSVEVQGATLTGRRTIAILTMPDRVEYKVESFPAPGLYLAMRLTGTPSGVEYRRQGIKLTFVGAPAAPAARPAPPSTPSGQAAETAPRRVGPGVPAPRQVKNVPPVYPPIALSARIQGAVVMDIVVGIDGSVVDAKIVRSIPLLDPAALEAARQWKFEPPIVDGVPTPIVMMMTTTFSLK